MIWSLKSKRVIQGIKGIAIEQLRWAQSLPSEEGQEGQQKFRFATVERLFKYQIQNPDSLPRNKKPRECSI